MKTFIVMTGWFCIGCVSAAEIRWVARGTVSTISGVGFNGTGVEVSNPAEFEMVYDSELLLKPRSYIPFGVMVAGDGWFHGAANLKITVRIGAHTWTGGMPVIASDANVMESSCWDFGGNPDVFKVTLDAARGGIFPDFPQAGAETALALTLEFRDSTTPAGLFDVHVLPGSLTKVCEMTSASGSIVAGASTIAMSIDPASVSVSLPQVPASIAKEEGGILLSWKTEQGKFYRIEGSSDLRCWSNDGVFPGDGEIRQQSLTPFELHPQRFYRIAEY